MQRVERDGVHRYRHELWSPLLLVVLLLVLLLLYLQVLLLLTFFDVWESLRELLQKYRHAGFWARILGSRPRTWLDAATCLGIAVLCNYTRRVRLLSGSYLFAGLGEIGSA